MTILKAIVGLAVLAYGGFVLLLYLLQDRFLFFPSKDVYVTPAQLGLAYEDVELRSGDGTRLFGWFVPAPRARGTVLFLHGNGGNIAHTIGAVETYARLGLNVLTFDYRGYGRSEGRPSGEGIESDAEAAWSYLTRERAIDGANIIVVGRSLGGGPASILARRHQPAALILESTFSSVAERASEQFPLVPVRALLRVRFDNRTELAHVRCPVLIVHSTDDELIPFAHAERLYAAANEPKQLVRISHGHNDGFALSSEVYVAALEDFISTALR